MDDIHILTSAKGGVGKTLLGVCAMLHYHDISHSVLGIDLNAMNPDFFRIMSFNGTQPVPQCDWERSTVAGHDISVVRPSEPRRLPDGAIGFWRKVEEIIRLEGQPGSDYIVDTNLHVANLVQSNESSAPFPVIEQVIGNSKRIYIWVIWSWAAFQEMPPIYAAFDSFSHRFGDRVSIVHVLNPSAILPPQTPLVTRTEYITAVSEAIMGLRKLTSMLGEEDSAQFLVKAIQYLKTDKAETSADDEYMVKGLYELSRARVVEPMSLTVFRDVVGEITKKIRESSPVDIYLFVPVNDMLQRKLLGISYNDKAFQIDNLTIDEMVRPNNVLAIGTHHLQLSGYTDRFARRPARSVNQISQGVVPSIRLTVSSFLTKLTPVVAVDML